MNVSVNAGASQVEIERVYKTRLSDFVRTATAICGDRETGREAVHDAFVSAVRSRTSFRGDGTVEAWVWRAVVNHALKQRVRHRETLQLPDLEAAGASGNGSMVELAAVRAAIARLPERQKLVLFLRYYGDMDMQQIADVLSIRRGTVSATLHAAHRTLRTQLPEEVKYP